MKLKCEVIQDLLPLYHDQVCSRETKELVEEHLLTCPTCREYLQSMDEELKLGDPAEAIKPLRDMSKRIKRMKTLAFSFGLLVAAVVIFILWAGFAKYSEFVGYLLHLTKRSLILVLPLFAIAVPVVLVLRKQFQKRNQVFPWGKTVSWLLLFGWAAAYLFATVFQGGYGCRNWNLQPFLMLREALNRFTPQLILNLFLNIGVFMPFGILMPILFRRQRKWRWALLTAVLTGMGFELLQLITAQGICDVDDVLMDTLGAMLGWSATMLVLSFKNGEKAKSLRYLTVPVGAILAVAAIFGSYYLKPYGNFPEGPAKWVDLKSVAWEKTGDFDGTSEKSAPVYRVGRITREQSEQFAMDFAARLGIQFNDVMYYDSMIIYGDRRGEGGFLNVYYQDGSWDYSPGNLTGASYDDPMEEQDRLLDYLGKLGVSVPESAEITGEDMEGPAPVVRIRILRDYDGKALRHGEIICRFFQREDHCELMEINNRVFTLEAAGHERIIGENQAYNLLVEGKSFHGKEWDGRTLTFSVSRPELDWQTDTKGFFQPVYRFTLTNKDNGRQFIDYVPALK